MTSEAHRHGHGEGVALHGSGETPGRHMEIALALTAGFMVVEAVTGWLTGSLTLLSDAGHMLTDAGALVLGLVAQAISRRQESGQRTFGYRRAEILAALANGVVLGATSVWIVVEAVRRFHAPPEVQGIPLLVVATLGLIVNLVAAVVLAGAGRSNANVRAAAANVAADAVGSVAAIVAGALVWGLHWNLADPIISIVISGLILWSAWKLVREAVHVLMEGVPPGVDLQKIERTIAETEGVAGVHDLHVWSISDGFPVVTVHVVLVPERSGADVAAAVARRIRQAHAIEHVTVQPEAPSQ